MNKDNWSIQDSKDLYGIERWGAGYFGISDTGDALVQAPTSKGTKKVSLGKIVSGLQDRGLEMPVMLRLENLVDDRITQLNQSFQNAIDLLGYKNSYRGVFPIKVNQQSHVVDEIARYGERFSHGLEAGSKAELLIALATLRNKDSFIVCNGYKDAEFIDLGIQALRLGFKCFFVIETPSELAIILERSAYWGIEPLIGLRLKLSTQVEGHWSGDSGDRSLFGLNSTQMVELLDQLQQAGKLNCLQLLHFHLGSQIPNIRNIRDGVKEACRFYIELIKEGANLQYFDLGGGLAIDYDGTNSSAGHSRNYSIEEYCTDIVEAVQDSLDAHDIPHPCLISESGRATVAPMSVLLFNILEVSSFDPKPASKPDENRCDPIKYLWETLEKTNSKHLLEFYNDAFYYRDQVRELFKHGQINLRERAEGENLHLSILKKVASLVGELKHTSPELDKLNDDLADIYYGNFSVFQSLPDAWAIQQVFPVMPIHRLNEQPSRSATIADLTCDCDGKLDKFVGPFGETNTLALHPLKNNEEYYLGAFLVGAYQETLGDLHNLFGDTNVASVRVDEDGELHFVHELAGDSIADVLSYVEYQPRDLAQQFRQSAEQAVREGQITVTERQQMLGLFNESLQGYTYFER